MTELLLETKGDAHLKNVDDFASVYLAGNEPGIEQLRDETIKKLTVSAIQPSP